MFIGAAVKKPPFKLSSSPNNSALPRPRSSLYFFLIEKMSVTMHIIPSRSRILRPATKALQKTFIAGYATNTSTGSLHRRPADGKNVIVTGSAGGIGKSIALRLALDGYNVCINDIPANEKACNEVVQQIQALGRKSCFAIGDVSKRGEVKDMIQRSVKELGPLHTMYCG